MIESWCPSDVVLINPPWDAFKIHAVSDLQSGTQIKEIYNLFIILKQDCKSCLSSFGITNSEELAVVI